MASDEPLIIPLLTQRLPQAVGRAALEKAPMGKHRFRVFLTCLAWIHDTRLPYSTADVSSLDDPT